MQQQAMSWYVGCCRTMLVDPSLPSPPHHASSHVWLWSTPRRSIWTVRRWQSYSVVCILELHTVTCVKYVWRCRTGRENASKWPLEGQSGFRRTQHTALSGLSHKPMSKVVTGSSTIQWPLWRTVATIDAQGKMPHQDASCKSDVPFVSFAVRSWSGQSIARWLRGAYTT